MPTLIKPWIGSLVRWLLTILSAQGLVVNEDQTSRLIDAAVLVATLAWSWWQKHQADKALALAKLPKPRWGS